MRPFKIQSIYLTGIIFFTSICALSAQNNIPVAKPGQPFKNPYGILVSQTNGYNLDPDKAAQLVHDLGAAYARINITNAQWYTESSRKIFLEEYNNYTKSTPSIGILLNVLWVTEAVGPEPFPGATQEYKDYIDDLIDTLTSPGYVKPALIVVENEENNVQFHLIESTADQDKYIAMLQYVVEEGHRNNLKVCNGAITNLGVMLSTWDYFLSVKRDTVRANTFLSNSFPEESIPALSNNFYTEKKNRALYYINAYKNVPMDYMNIHWYEPAKLIDWYEEEPVQGVDTAHMSPGSLEEVFAYFSDTNVVGRKPLICNEAGQITPSDAIVQELTCALQGMPFVVWYSGDRDEFQSIRPYRQWGLHTNYPTGARPYKIRPNGILFRENIKRIVDNPFDYCPQFQGNDSK
jgi:hypothetical protein